MVERSLQEEHEKAVLTGAKLETPGIGFDRWWLLVLAIIGMILILVLGQPDPYARAVTFVSDGILVTLGVTIVSFLIVAVVGLFGGLGRLSHNR